MRPGRNTGRDTGDLRTMAPHHCSYCLKPIATKPGIKWHITQSPACCNHQNQLLERAQFAESNGEDDPAEEINDNAPLYEWGDKINVVDGVSQSVDLGRSNNPNTTPTKDYENVQVVVYLRGVQKGYAEEGERGSTPTG